MPERAAPLVLYVEDDRIHLILMEEVFRLLPGWELRCAETGAEALAALAECRPMLALVDMHLPDISGLEVVRRLNEEIAQRGPPPDLDAGMAVDLDGGGPADTGPVVVPAGSRDASV